MRLAVYSKDPSCFQDLDTLQVYRVEYCPDQHVCASGEVADEMLAHVVAELVARHNAVVAVVVDDN